VTNIREMTIFGITQLENAKSLPICDNPDAHGDREDLTQVGTELVGQFRRPGGEDIDVLRHPRFIHVRVHRLGAEQCRIITVPEEFKYRVMNLRQRKRLIHCELPEAE
jgi:hypothetical protein